MAQEVRPVRTAQTPQEAEDACTTLREHGIKCACVEAPSERARTSPFRWLVAAVDRGTVLTVIVAPEDADRAREILER
jgi:hypothetical protein